MADRKVQTIDGHRTDGLHRVFALGIWIKGIDGLLEVIGGLLLPLTSSATLN